MIEQSSIIFTLIAQVSLSFCVLLYLGKKRISFLRKNRVHPKKVATRQLSSEVFKTISSPSDNFKNLFEVPTLFIPLPIILLQLGLVDNTYLVMAWAFVMIRVVHSIVHCTDSSVMIRFYAFFSSSMLLWAMWIRLAIELI